MRERVILKNLHRNSENDQTFDGWMEFAVKRDQAVIVENLKTFPEKFVEDKHGTERKCLSMTNDL